MSQIDYSTSSNKNNNIIRNSASIDLEWIPYKGEYSHEKTKLTAAAFCTNQGIKLVLCCLTACSKYGKVIDAPQILARA
jgi:hypothetical protein